jgi:hypothetical protein
VYRSRTDFQEFNLGRFRPHGVLCRLKLLAIRQQFRIAFPL